MKKGWTNVDPEALSVPAGAFRSAARNAALLLFRVPPAAVVVVVAGVEEELQADSKAAAASPRAARGASRRVRFVEVTFGVVIGSRLHR